MSSERTNQSTSTWNPPSFPTGLSPERRDSVGSLLEAGCIVTILLGSFLLFALLSGCSNPGKGDIDLGLKAKIETTKSSSNSPLEAKPLTPEATGSN